ncbi:hypothetical protein [Streptomyces platensis]
MCCASAVIALDGVYDLGDMATGFLSLDRAEAERRLRADRDPELDAAVEAAMAASPKIRRLVDQGMYVMGADTPRGLFATFLDHHLRDGIAIAVPAVLGRPPLSSPCRCRPAAYPNGPVRRARLQARLRSRSQATGWTASPVTSPGSQRTPRGAS